MVSRVTLPKCAIGRHEKAFQEKKYIANSLLIEHLAMTLTVCELENSPVEIVGLAIGSMVILFCIVFINMYKKVAIHSTIFTSTLRYFNIAVEHAMYSEFSY